MMRYGKKQQQQNKKTKLKILARAGNQTQDLLHSGLELNLSANESTELINHSQVI